MKRTLPSRIVRLEDGLWRIRGDDGELDGVEQDQLEDYFTQIGMPYQMVDGRACVPGRVSWECLDESLTHFYDGRAEVFPF